ncbi:hypothetical protein PIB30_074176 [Stylosanthes scabra]|uniref:DUF4283 domain-containing protein n=1 Tax=Stylosanthes scabra TaxID=79078 RepID=A0ABU6QP58_9FABA|nr:hypothetical protein [Stylosanthes scabra]
MPASAVAQFLVDHGGQEDLEERVVNFDDEDICEGVENCSKSLIGKLLSSRSFSRWEENLKIKETEFIKVPLWIQLCGVPDHCKTRKLAMKVGGALGKVLDADLFQMRSGNERILKVKVQLHITMPLRRNLKISGNTHRKHRKPTPINLLREFANISVQEDNSQVKNSYGRNQDDNRLLLGRNKEDGVNSQEVLHNKEKALTEPHIPFSTMSAKYTFEVGPNNARGKRRRMKRQSLKRLARKGATIINPVIGMKRRS